MLNSCEICCGGWMDCSVPDVFKDLRKLEKFGDTLDLPVCFLQLLHNLGQIKCYVDPTFNELELFMDTLLTPSHLVGVPML